MTTSPPPHLPTVGLQWHRRLVAQSHNVFYLHYGVLAFFEILTFSLYSLPLCIFETPPLQSLRGGGGSAFMHRFTAWLVLQDRYCMTRLFLHHFARRRGGIHVFPEGEACKRPGATVRRLEVARRCSVGEGTNCRCYDREQNKVGDREGRKRQGKRTAPAIQDLV